MDEVHEVRVLILWSRIIVGRWFLVLPAQTFSPRSGFYETKEEQTTDGTLGTRLESRLVPRSFTQMEGGNYSKTYDPVAKLSPIRVLLALAAQLDLLLHQMDVVTLFLNGELKSGTRGRVHGTATGLRAG